MGHVVPAFNQLRKILRLSTEWTTVTIRFRDGLLRSLIFPVHDNRRELKETAYFQNQTISRVNDEFTNDIVYQSLEETPKEKEVLLPELNLVL